VDQLEEAVRRGLELPTTARAIAEEGGG
jgi:hypothetical protein